MLLSYRLSVCYREDLHWAELDGWLLLRRQATVRKWAAEVASRARFASALPPEEAAANPGSLPVPCLVINNKADLRGAKSPPFASNRSSFCSTESADPFLPKTEGVLQLHKWCRMPCKSCLTACAIAAQIHVQGWKVKQIIHNPK